MRILKWMFRVILLLVVVFVAGAYLLPREVQVVRSVDINAGAADIFPHINNLEANQAWSPWLARDPEVVLNYGEVVEGVGATMAWMSEHPQVGSGNMEITKSDANSHITTELDFGDMGTATAFFDLNENAGVTKVTWGFTTDTGMNPMQRWVGMMLDGWVGPDYEQGLNNLKDLVEG